MTGETLYEEEADELDEDYLDPSFLHTAAELYNNQDLFYEMQSQIESTHGHHVPHPAMMVMSGYPHGMDEEDLYNYDSGGMPSRARTFSNAHPMASHQQDWSEEFAMVDEERDQTTLSPRQYALLMQSMQEPLAMYASTLDSSMLQDDDNDVEGFEEGLTFSGGGGGVGNRQRRMHPSISPGMGLGVGSHQMQVGATPMGEVDPMMLYGPGRYNPSPTYTYATGTTGTGTAAAGPITRQDEHNNMVQMWSPVPPPSGEGYEYEQEAVHPASGMMGPSVGYPSGGSGPPVRVPVPPPPRTRPNRPSTRPAF